MNRYKEAINEGHSENCRYANEYGYACDCGLIPKFPNWEIIDSAPKDGTHILTCSPHHPIVETFWLQDVFGGWCWGGKGWYYPEWSQPTHWMPCPKKPDF